MEKVKASLAALRFLLEGNLLASDCRRAESMFDPLGLARWSGSRKLRNTNDSNRQPGPGPGGSTEPMDDGQSPRYVTQ